MEAKHWMVPPEVYDGKNAICSCSVDGNKVPSYMDVKDTLKKNGVAFEFSLATKYLASSQFQVIYQPNVNFPEIHFYRFSLPDFVRKTNK